ncbi:MAG: hypothetical protein HOP27_10105 [Anaerolineales bacterium]|nr:hypothetical protein [Anaerolineales bacterium]
MKKSILKNSKRICVILPLMLFAISACQTKVVTNAPDDQISTIVASTMSAYSSVTPEPTEIHSVSKTYANEVYGFAFDYPQTWNVTETIVPKGTRLFERSFHRFDAGSDDYDELIVEVAKGSEWILEIIARKSIQNCGGYSSDFLEITSPVPNSSNYQSIEILGQNAVRLRPEDGYAWKVPEPREPYPVIVVFPNRIEECPNHDEKWLLFGVSDNQRPLSLSITYYSSQFTDVNLQNRAIDYLVIQEMDRIAESLRYLDE